MRELIILGGSGRGQDVLSLARSLNYSVIGFLDDSIAVGTLINNVPVLGGITNWRGLGSDTEVFVAVGNPKVRLQLMQRFASNQSVTVKYAQLIHPTAVIFPGVKIGEGTSVLAGAIVQQDVVIGAHANISIGVTIGHTTIVEDFVNLAPQAAVSGDVKICKGVSIGTASCIREKITIGEGAVVGMGAVVVKNVLPWSVVVGNPAARVKFNEQ